MSWKWLSRVDRYRGVCTEWTFARGCDREGTTYREEGMSEGLEAGQLGDTGFFGFQRRERSLHQHECLGKKRTFWKVVQRREDTQSGKPVTCAEGKMAWNCGCEGNG